MKWKTLLLILALSASVANATTFDLSTLNENSTGYWTGPNGTGTKIFNSSINQLAPWTEGTGASQASINFTVPTMGNNSGKIYMSAGGAFPIPTGQTKGQNQNGYSGDYATSNGFPLYFAFSNPTYDKNCGFNCNTITQVPVTLDSLYLYGLVAGATITGYSDLGHTAIDTVTLSGSGLQQITLDWTGIEEIAISGSGYYVNDIEVNDPLPTPEPTSLTLLGTGLIALAGLAKRKVCR
jgi:hypothetical protein